MRSCSFEDFIYKPIYEKLGKKQCAAKQTHPDAVYRRCRESVTRNRFCFYHNMLRDKGCWVEKY